MKAAVGVCLVALAWGTVRAEELFVDEGETRKLATDSAYDGGSVKGTLVLSGGMTLTLANNVFEAGSKLILNGATLAGFAGAYDVTLPCAIEVTEGTENVLDNCADLGGEYTAGGCNVTVTGPITGAGRVLFRSVGRGIRVIGDAGEFEGTLAFDMTGGFFSGRLESDQLSKATVEVVGGLFPFNRTNAHYGSLIVRPGATFRCDRGWNDSNNLNLYGDSVLGGVFEGNELDVNVRAEAAVTVDAVIARMNLFTDAALAGKGTIGRLDYGERTVYVSNGANDVLTVGQHVGGTSVWHEDGEWLETKCGRIVIDGLAEGCAGNDVLVLGDAATDEHLSVTLSDGLRQDGWKLRVRTEGDLACYSIARPGLMVIIR